MFRRKWSSLPEEKIFPSDLKSLGYFVNEQDEIRSINDPDSYFHFFLSKNGRVNDRQRFHFNGAVEDIIASRLEEEGLQRIRLPMSPITGEGHPVQTNPTQPHVPIYVSTNLSTASRIVLIIGESTQDLGVVAHRVIGGPGGVDAGSMVSVVRAIKRQRATATDHSPPGIVLANPGQLWWWPQGQRALCRTRAQATPMRSAVHWGTYYDPAVNSVPENRTPQEHVRYVFGQVVATLAGKEARIDVLGVGDGADEVAAFLNNDETWKLWGPRLNSLSMLGSFYKPADVTCAGLKQFLRERTRLWCTHLTPLNTLISGPDGNPNTYTFTQAGCPIFSGGTDTLIELLLVKARGAVLEWIQEVALAGPTYKNPEFKSDFVDLPEHSMEWEDDTTEQRKVPELEADAGSDDEEKDRKAQDENRIEVRLKDMSIKE